MKKYIAIIAAIIVPTAAGIAAFHKTQNLGMSLTIVSTIVGVGAFAHGVHKGESNWTRPIKISMPGWKKSLANRWTTSILVRADYIEDAYRAGYQIGRLSIEELDGIINGANGQDIHHLDRTRGIPNYVFAIRSISGGLIGIYILYSKFEQGASLSDGEIFLILTEERHRIPVAKHVRKHAAAKLAIKAHVHETIYR